MQVESPFFVRTQSLTVELGRHSTDLDESEKLESTISSFSKFSNNHEKSFEMSEEEEAPERPLPRVLKLFQNGLAMGLTEREDRKIDDMKIAKWATIFKSKKDLNENS